MTVELALLLTGVSVAFAIFFGIANVKRNRTKDTQEDTAQLTTVIVKLENISTLCTEIKTDVKAVKDDIKDHEKRLVVVEQSTKSAHKRIDEMKGEKFHEQD